VGLAIHEEVDFVMMAHPRMRRFTADVVSFYGHFWLPPMLGLRTPHLV
jgi:hypothetical protein